MMAPDFWYRVKDVFAAAAPLDPDARVSFLREVCGDDRELQRRVERLLVHHDADRGLLGGESESEWAPSRPSEKPVFAIKEVLCDRFRIVSYIGRGGMGEVYEAEDLELGGRIALKALRAELLGDDRSVSRFKQEIQLARRVTHPHVCRIFDVGRHRRAGDDREHAFLTMELLAGETLASHLKAQGRLSCEQAWPLIVQMAEGLDALHRASIVHRDFKPGNVMLTHDAEGRLRAVITDFGLAHHVTREASGVPTDTVAGQIIGTLDYMAPEQLVGESAGPATDIFAFGVVVYETLTTGKPFAGSERGNRPLAPAPGLPHRWHRTIQSCLRTSATERPPSMAAVLAGFGMSSTGGPLGHFAPDSVRAPERASSATENTSRRFALRRRHVLGLSLTGAAATLVLAGIERRRDGDSPSFHTSSPEAARAFDRAVESMRVGHYKAAADQLREAVRRDPEFALAHVELGRAQIGTGQYERGHASAQRAYDLMIRSPEAYTIWDHYRVLGRFKRLRCEYSAAREDFRALAGFALERASRSWFDRDVYYAVAVEGFRERALAYCFDGFALEAQGEIRKALAYDPQNPELDVLESLFFVEQGNGREALARAQGAWRKVAGPDPMPTAYPALGEGMARLLLRDPVRAAETFRGLGEARNEPQLSAWGTLFEVQADIFAGNWPDAMAKLTKSEPFGGTASNSWIATKRELWIAELAALMGTDWRNPLRRLEELAGAEPAPQNVVIFRDAALLAGLEGDLEVVQRFGDLITTVEQAFPRLGSSSDRPESIPFVRRHAEHVRGEEARLRGDLDTARAIFSDLANSFPRDARIWLSLGRLQASADLLEGAVAAYQRILPLRGRILTQDCCTLLLRSYLELARCLGRASRQEEARRYYDEFLHSAGDGELAAQVLAERNSSAP